MDVLAGFETGDLARWRARSDDADFAFEGDVAFKDRVRAIHGSKRRRRIVAVADAGLAFAVVAEAACFQDGGHADGG